VPKKYKKFERKMGLLGEIEFRNFWGKLGENGEIGGWRWVGAVEKCRWWCVGGVEVMGGSGFGC
jgi:hypothetical protein